MRPLFRPADAGPVNIHDLVINASFVCSGWRPSGHGVLSGPLPERTAARRLVGGLQPARVCFYISQRLTAGKTGFRSPCLSGASARYGETHEASRGDAFHTVIDIWTFLALALKRKKPCDKLREVARKDFRSLLDIWIGGNKLHYLLQFNS